MKKHIKTVIIFGILGFLIVGYYFYLSNRDLSATKTGNKDVNIQELNELKALNLDSNYPDTPLEVTKLYVRIMRAFYRTDLDNEDIEKLATQVQKIFDDELLEANPYDAYLENLKKDIKDYNKANRYITDYKIERNSEVDYKTLGKKQYAMVDTIIYLREGSNLTPVTMKFTLRKDESGKWRILFWQGHGSSGEKNESK